MRNQKGITLIELMVVIAVMGILATLAILNIKDIRVKVLRTNALENKVTVQKAVDRFYSEKTRFPSSVQPTLQLPSFPDWTQLVPPYLHNKPSDTDKMYYWIDTFGTVWVSDSDSPKVTTSTNGDGTLNLSWPAVDNAEKYVVGYSDGTAYIWVQETTTTSVDNLNVPSGSISVISSISNSDLQSVPVGSGYTGGSLEVATGGSGDTYNETFANNTYKDNVTTATWIGGSLPYPVSRLGITGMKNFKNGRIYDVIQDGSNYISAGSLSGDWTPYGGSNTSSLVFGLIKYDSNFNVVKAVNPAITTGSLREFNEVIVDRDGNYVAAGTSYGSLASIGGKAGLGLNDNLIVKFDRDLNILSVNNFGGTQNEMLYSLIQDSNGDYVAAGYKVKVSSGPEFGTIYKFDNNLNVTATKEIGGTAGGTTMYSLIQDNDGNYVLAGTTEDNLTSIGGTANVGIDVVFVKLDSSLNVALVKSITGDQSDGISEIVQGSDGNYAFAGASNSNLTTYGSMPVNNRISAMMGTIDKNFSTIKVKQLYANGNTSFMRDIVENSDGDFVAVGRTNGDMTANNAMYVGAYNGDTYGDILIARLGKDATIKNITVDTGIDQNYEGPNSVIQNSSGEYITVGWANGNLSNLPGGTVSPSGDCAFIAKYNLGDGYDTMKNTLQSKKIDLGGTYPSVKITADVTLPAYTKYDFYISNNGSTWMKVGAALDGTSDIGLLSPSDSIYWKAVLLGTAFETPEFNSIKIEPSNVVPKRYSVSEVPFQYESATTLVSGGWDDETQYTINLGFNVNYGGGTYSTLQVASNGYMSFDSSADMFKYSYENFADGTTHDSIIAPYMTDLSMKSSVIADSGIYYKTGNDGKNYVLIEYRNVFSWDSSRAVGYSGNFEVKIYEDGKILVSYKNISFGNNLNGLYASGAVYVDSTNYAQYFCNENKLHDNLTILYEVK